MTEVTLYDGVLPLFYNIDKVKIQLFNPQDDNEIVAATKEKFFIPSYRVSKDTVKEWINKFSILNTNLETKLLSTTESILLTYEDAGEFPRYGAAIWFKPIRELNK